MKERPILFSGKMVRALLEGRKTQTRRVIKNPKQYRNIRGCSFCCPHGHPGSRLIVKESAWMWCEKRPNGKTKLGRPKWNYVPLKSAPIFYCHNRLTKPQTDVISPNTGNSWGWRKKIGPFLPRWASTITLEITDVRVQRVQEISEDDAIAEGTIPAKDSVRKWGVVQEYRMAFADLWDSINAERGVGWEANPWVWAITFRRIK